MNIWFFIILAIAIAIVVGPITMLKPNPSQRRKEQLRLLASKRGAHFSMRRLPALKTDIDQPLAIPVYYLPPRSPKDIKDEWILMRTSYVHEGNFYQEWDWQTDVRPAREVCECLKLYLPKLPVSVPAISQGNLGVCVFWLEREGEEMLMLLIEMLSKLQQSAE
jgi:hypothetical protein